MAIQARKLACFSAVALAVAVTAGRLAGQQADFVPEEYIGQTEDSYVDSSVEPVAHYAGAPVIQGTVGCNYCTTGCRRCTSTCRQGWTAGIEAPFLRPDRSTSGILPSLGDDTFEYRESPRIWLGYTYDSGWGMRGRFWRYFNDFAVQDVIGDFAGGEYLNIALNGGFELATFDIELTRRRCFGWWDVTGSLGIRYAKFEEDLGVSISDVNLNTAPQEVSLLSVEQNQRFEGAGFTLGVDAVRPIACSPFSFFCTARGSLIFGRERLLVDVRDVDFEVLAGVLTLVDDQDLLGGGEGESTMWIGEFQIGGQWSAHIPCVRNAEVFMRAGYEVQWWGLGGGIDVFIPPDNVTTSGPSDTFFYGPVVSVGFQR